jgi:hypothetical protein
MEKALFAEGSLSGRPSWYGFHWHLPGDQPVQMLQVFLKGFLQQIYKMITS